MIRETLIKTSKLGREARSIGYCGIKSRDRERENSGADIANVIMWVWSASKRIIEPVYRELYFQLYTYFIAAR